MKSGQIAAAVILALLFFFFLIQGLALIVKRAIKFDSPIKRIGSILFLVGIISLVFGLFQIAFDVGSAMDLVHEVIDAACLGNGIFSYNKPTAFGLYASATGGLLSFLYDAGIGRVVKWIIHGSV